MKLKIQPLCVFYFLSIAVFSSIWTCVGAFLALLIHELAHLLAGYWLGEKAESVEFTPFGGVIRYPFGVSAMKGLRGLAVAGAGPLANYAMLWLLSMPWAKRLPQPFLQQTLFMHAGMLFLNLLPVLPLDGGRALKAMLTRQLGYIAAISIMRRLSRIVTVFLFVCVALLLLVTGLNISLLMVAAFLTLYMTEEKKENDYVIMQELLYTKNKLKNRGLMRTQSLTATDALAARSVLKRLCYDAYHIVYIVDQNQRLLRTVTEAQIVEALTEKGWHITLGEVR